MKKTIFLLAGSVILGLGACKKDGDNDTQTRKDMIVGTWNASQTGVDANNNSTLDANETATSPWTGSVRFDANGMAYSALTFAGTTSLDTVSWALESNEQVLRTIQDGDTDRIKLIELTPNRMVTLDKPDTNPGTWDVFTK